MGPEIFVIGLIIILALWYPVSNKMNEEGVFLDKRIKPYYNAIMILLSPYKNTYFVKSAIIYSKKTLKYLLNNCNLENDFDVSKIMFINPNPHIVRVFSLMYVISHHDYSPLTPPEEELNAIRSLKDYCSEKLSYLIDDVPESFWDYFELKKENFLKK